MRRALALLSLSVAAFSVATPAAHAYEPMCTTVWTEGSAIPNVGPEAVCFNYYPYGQSCETDSVFVWPQAAVYVDWCTPGVI